MTRLRRGPSRARVVVAVALGLLLAGCQVADDGDLSIVVTEAPAADDAALGSPDQDWPRSLPALQAVAEQEALAWQPEPVLADLAVWLDEDGAWERAALTYVAPAADRMLVYRTSPDSLRIERPVLSGLLLPELPRAATDQMTPLPAEVLEPAALVEAAGRALADCDGDGRPVEAVLYATGAPAAWDGQRWTATPTWRATVVTDEVGVVVDPRTGQAFAPLTCVEPLLAEG